MRLSASSLQLNHQRWAASTKRALHMRRKWYNPFDIPMEVFRKHPKPAGIQPDPDFKPFVEPDPYIRSAVTSAHMVDAASAKICDKDSATIDDSTGVVTHGRYGALDADKTAATPLEYLALLRPAAEGAAAVRKLTSESQVQGTILVHNMSEASGLAAVQLAQAGGHTVVGVVGENHNGHVDWMEFMKGIVNEPGTAVAAQYAMAKKNFADLVHCTVTGDAGFASHSQEDRLNEFKQNLLDYTEAYPEDRPAAVNKDILLFDGMDKDREQFRANLEAYLSQFPPGSPPVVEEQLNASFTNEQYEIFREKFWKQTSGIIAGDELNFFSPPHIVQDLLKDPEEPEVHKTSMSYYFSHMSETKYPEGFTTPAGGPLLGAVIAVTPVLEKVMDTMDKCKTLREKAEALQFMTDIERGVFHAASSVASVAQKAGAPVIAIGGKIPGAETAEATAEDVDEALSAMDILEDGSSKLNYFIQVFRSNDYPFYGDYAIHKATEVHAGPRQMVVTK